MDENRDASFPALSHQGPKLNAPLLGREVHPYAFPFGTILAVGVVNADRIHTQLFHLCRELCAPAENLDDLIQVRFGWIRRPLCTTLGSGVKVRSDDLLLDLTIPLRPPELSAPAPETT